MTTKPPRIRRRRRPARVPLASVARQTRTDASPLAVASLVVALVAFVAAVVPRLTERVSNDEIRAALDDAGSRADVVVNAPLTEEFIVPRPLLNGTAGDTEWIGTLITGGLPKVFAPPVTTIVSRDLDVGSVEGRPGKLRLGYVAQPGSSGVTWVHGGPPGETPDVSKAIDQGLRFPVEVGLSEAVADVLGISWPRGGDAPIGAVLHASDPSGMPVDLHVTGIFRVDDPSDSVWSTLPTLVDPKLVGGAAPRTEVAALLSDDSLPFARLDLPLGMLTRTYTYAVDADAVGIDNAEDVATSIRRIAAGSDDIGASFLGTTLRTRIDTIFDDAVSRVESASAQASLVLVGVLSAALFVVLLAAALVTQRRRGTLVHLRAHGASLPAIAVALLAESVVVTAAAASIGIVAAGLVVPGSLSWSWVAPPVVVAAVAPPLWGVREAARRTAPPPAKRLDNRPGIRSAPARRAAFEIMVAVLAVGSVAALRARGVEASASSLGADLVVLAAPVLVAATVAIALIRVLPPLWAWTRRASAHTRGAVPVLVAARTRTVGLPLATVVVATSLLTVALAIDATVRVGQEGGSWESVGADVAVAPPAGGGLPYGYDAVSDRDGVVAAASAWIAPGSQLLGGGVDAVVRVVAIDATSFERLLDATPYPAAPQLAELASAGDAVAVPALSRGVDPVGQGAMVLWEGTPVPITIVGKAPSVPGDGATRIPTIIVDEAALAAALGGPIEPDTADGASATVNGLDPTAARRIGATQVLWVVGPGSDAAVTAVLGDEDVDITTRAKWLSDRRSAPVTSAMTGLLIGSAGFLVLLLILVVGLVSSAGARARADAIAGFRVLGLRRASATRVAAGEVLAPVLVASVAGTLTGVAIAVALAGPLSLAALTGQSSAPSLVVPWWVWLAIPGLALATLAGLAIELAGHRRERLGQVMRAG